MHNYENEGAGQLPGEALTGAIQAENMARPWIWRCIRRLYLRS